MITIISGLCGKGKTALLAKMLFEQMVENGEEDYFNLKHEVKILNGGGFGQLSLPPQHHLCYSDFPFKISKRLESYYIDGYRLALSNPFFDTAFIPPYSTIFLDEAQRYYDSRMSKYLRPEVYRWFQLHRHNDYNIFLVCQRVANIDVNIRALAERIWVVLDLAITQNKWGLISRLTWKIREFHSCDTAESFQLSQDKNEVSLFGEEKELSCDYSVFDYYNSKGCRPVFYNGNYCRDYDYFLQEGYAFTLQSFVDFNNANYFVAPKGFYINSAEDKKTLEKLGVTSEEYYKNLSNIGEINARN